MSEITQIGAELMNDASSDADGEMIAMTIEALIFQQFINRQRTAVLISGYIPLVPML